MTDTLTMTEKESPTPPVRQVPSEETATTSELGRETTERRYGHVQRRSGFPIDQYRR